MIIDKQSETDFIKEEINNVEEWNNKWENEYFPNKFMDDFNEEMK